MDSKERRELSKAIKVDLTKLSVGVEAGPTGVHENGHEVWLLTRAVFSGDSARSRHQIIVGPRDCKVKKIPSGRIRARGLRRA